MQIDKFVPIIGLEVHVELKTESKMFCGCSASYFGHEPNTHVCPVCLGLPGALPVPNQKAVEWCILLGLALNCQIPQVSKFDRKNYFYPDLPKGYQISQYDTPLCVNGFLELRTMNQELRKIRIRRVHMEEDTAKLIHTKEGTLIDFNRSGVPLVEIVTEPDIHSAQEAKIFLQNLAQIIRYLGVSDCDMEKGSMRLEPNISIKGVHLGRVMASTSFQPATPEVKKGGKDTSDGVRRHSSEVEELLPDYKVEIKNINSFRFVEKAINYEIKRQTELLKKGEIVRQETRGFDPQKGITLPQRGKEEAQDYRYFPEPDIPPMRWNKATILKLQAQIPELPDAKLARFMKEYGLSEYDANILTSSLSMANYYEEAIKMAKEQFSPGRSPFGHLPGGAKRLLEGVEITPKTIANLIINKKVDVNKTSPIQLIQIILQKTQAPTISGEELKNAVEKVLLDNPKAVSDYKAGKTQALMFLVGQVLKETKGQAEAEKVKEKLVELVK